MSSRPGTAQQPLPPSGPPPSQQQAGGGGTDYARRDLGGHKAAVTCVAWSAKGKWLATASEDGIVRVWGDIDPSWVTSSRSDKKPDRELLHNSKEVITALAFHPKREELLAVVGSNETRVFDIERKSGSGSCVFDAPTPEAIAVAWLGHEALLVAQLNNTLTQLDLRRRGRDKARPLQIREGDEITDIALIDRGHKVLIATRYGVEVWAWPLAKGAQPLCVLMGHSKHHGRDGGVTAMALTRGDKGDRLLASGGMDALVCIWDLASGAPASVVYQPDEAVRALSFSSDQALLAYSQNSLPGQQSGIDVVAMPSGKPLYRVPLLVHSESVAFNPRYPRLLAFAAEAEVVPGRHYSDKPSTNGKAGVVLLGR